LRGFHQIPVAEADTCKTAVITPFGLFEFPRTPFGLCNAAQAFQRMMDTTLAGLPFIFVYIDDILVASATREQHLKDLREVFERLAANGLSVKPSKCLFGQEAVRFLSHEVDANGVMPQTSKVDAVKRFPQPETVKGLQGFLGMVNYYQCFIPRAARMMQPMYDLLKGKPACNAVVDSTAEAKAAFTSTKAALASATMLVHPRVGAELALTVDVLDMAVGGALEQRGDQGKWEPLAFFSRKLDATQARYSAFNRELLAAHSAVSQFKYYLEGRKFAIFTDH
jgi:hypothetical protein